MFSAMKLCQAVSILALSVSIVRASSETEAARAKYNHKFAEVLQDGLVVGYCSGIAGGTRFDMMIGEDGAKVSNIFKCPTQPVRKGEMLTIENVRTVKRVAPSFFPRLPCPTR